MHRKYPKPNLLLGTNVHPTTQFQFNPLLREYFKITTFHPPFILNSNKMSNTFSTIPYISTIIGLIIKTTFNIKIKKPTSNLSLYSSYSVSSYILYLNNPLPLQDSPHQYPHLLLKEFNRLPINFFSQLSNFFLYTQM